jgi:hypothetical protein
VIQEHEQGGGGEGSNADMGERGQKQRCRQVQCGSTGSSRLGGTAVQGLRSRVIIRTGGLQMGMR